MTLSFRNLSKGFCILIIVALLFNITPPHAVKAASIVVNTLDDEYNNDGDCSLQEAFIAASYDSSIDACAAGSGSDTITFSVSGTIPVSTILNLTSGSLLLDGEDKITLTSTASTLLNFYSGTSASIQNIILSGGNVAVSTDQSTVNLTNVNINGFSSATSNRGSTIIINNSVFDNNISISGGYEYGGNSSVLEIHSSELKNAQNAYNTNQIHYTSGSVTITDSTFSNSPRNSWIFIYTGTSLTIDNSTFSNNVETYNGAAAIDNMGTATITSTVFDNNRVSGSANFYGGAIKNQGTMQIDHSVFTNNGGTSNYNLAGGAIRNEYGTLTITDSFFSGNYVGEYDNPTVYIRGGGAISSYQGTVNVSNSTFT